MMQPPCHVLTMLLRSTDHFCSLAALWINANPCAYEQTLQQKRADSNICSSSSPLGPTAGNFGLSKPLLAANWRSSLRAETYRALRAAATVLTGMPRLAASCTVQAPVPLLPVLS